MKILFAPLNMASMPAITAKAMNMLGHEAKCLSFGTHKYHSENEAVTVLKSCAFRVNPILWFYYKTIAVYTLYRMLRWCDVVHWTWDGLFLMNVDLLLVKWSGKLRFIEWIGSEIRVPEVTMKESPWYKTAYDNGYEYRNKESREKSYAIQEKFARMSFIPILVPEMQLFLKPGLFPEVIGTQYRIDCRDSFVPSYPKLQNDKIVIVHSPSAIIAKGSNYIIPVLEELKARYPIEFILLHNVPREQVLDTMQRCDIYIDQIILGSYALAAMEAMSFGKPVLAYIMPSVYKMGTPESCPVVNANPDTLKQRLVELVESPQLRYELGVKSRAYVEEVHDAKKLGLELIANYEKYAQLKN